MFFILIPFIATCQINNVLVDSNKIIVRVYDIDSIFYKLEWRNKKGGIDSVNFFDKNGYKRSVYSLFDVDIKPAFNDSLSISEYLKNKLIIPSFFDGKGFVVISFIIDENGDITNIHVDSEIPYCSECTKSALNIIGNLKRNKKFRPAKKNNNFVCTYFILPIDFNTDLNK